MDLLDQIKKKISPQQTASATAEPNRDFRIKKIDDAYYIGPFDKQDCKYDWVGPYETKGEATEDMRGMLQFLKQTD